MATEIIMPTLGLTMTEGTVDAWLKDEGDQVEKGEAVCTISSEKLSQDVEAPEEGTLIKILVPTGEVAPCKDAIGLIGEAAEEVSSETEKEDTTEETPKEEPSDKRTEPVKPKDEKAKGDRIFITPLARKVAKEKGIDYSQIKGTGGNGRITRRDVEMFQPQEESVTATTVTSAGAGLTGMRKTIAQRMTSSLQNTAQVTIQQKADVTQLMAFRKEIKENAGMPLTDGQMSITTLLSKATILALQVTPKMNALYHDGKLEEFAEVHLGMAVAVDEGLIVPVVQNADKMTLTELGKTLNDRIEKTQQGTLESENYSGSTFTITNLGKGGAEYFTPILNPPETGILGVGSMLNELVLDEEGQVVQNQKLPLSLTFDHQVIDGAPAADFLGKIISYLENPYSLIL
ncbi:dihydrolipoamide acetyltransferase family protein [Tetragenococcus koreensis]|uniref:Dihydrolipoamide acetyltransferase component of pyruvate dehydrogenase complex n=1 Tax=Tetragenococcus koreensis TaxID=290335 RepID=A0AAN4RJR0_9ENTE|nr:dihydrolipoamide acetyltransferase family protein [Tetragenococcus koreensis]GEQ48894.1 branched-chain alpha-keto acid dehydrogenase subunit E2 [Tetragenococcus koreensis]GEQ51323.1 branched-chain alpha-keto acid dehydrogenase subunit E2 [Tetragenococcus koreensis]GEQ53972.1 branched-chain alpha-keto acid dehydrogenase subunit E2 [Tetragenococcus koreensis]GEQ56284.1 branched-chain alpha-keto acid dehydrogenase subunit E2 [Tetragenococcus koreensis]GEQ58866.1 branched-chain alpha-keto acid 